MRVLGERTRAIIDSDLLKFLWAELMTMVGFLRKSLARIPRNNVAAPGRAVARMGSSQHFSKGQSVDLYHACRGMHLLHRRKLHLLSP